MAPQTEDAVQSNGGSLEVDGQQGKYVVMTMHVYDAMLGISDNEEAETLASVRRGIVDVAAGRAQEASAAFNKLEGRYAA